MLFFWNCKVIFPEAHQKTHSQSPGFLSKMVIAILYILRTPLFSFLMLSSIELKALQSALKKKLYSCFPSFDPDDEMQPPLWWNTATAYDSE